MSATALLYPHFADLTLAAIATTPPIAAIPAEHDRHGAHIPALEVLTSNFVSPEDACPTWSALYVGGRRLADDLMEPIHPENDVPFPRFLG